MTQSLDDLLAELARDQEQKEHDAQSYESGARECRKIAQMIGERIRGIKEARAALQPQPDITGNGAGPSKTRAPRRNIRAMVREQLEKHPAGTAKMIAQLIGCRESQVEAAIAAMKDGKLS